MCEFQISLAHIGAVCGEYRKSVLRMTQSEVATQTGYTRSNISKFERGQCNSIPLLMWYIEKGVPIDDLSIKSLIGGEINGA